MRKITAYSVVAKDNKLRVISQEVFSDSYIIKSRLASSSMEEALEGYIERELESIVLGNQSVQTFLGKVETSCLMVQRATAMLSKLKSSKVGKRKANDSA